MVRMNYNFNNSHEKVESAKSRAWRARVLTCLACLRAWRVCVLGVFACLVCLRAYVLAFL